MRIVIVDGYTINSGDISWSPLEILGDFTCYDRSNEYEIISRIKGSDVAINTSKCHITRDIMEACPNLKFIGIMATGYENVDLEAARDHNIAVCNVPAYSTEAVLQHTLALILEITNSVGNYSKSTSEGKWYTCKDFMFIEKPLYQLSGKSIGIIGYGNIGKRVGEVASALGMKVNIYSNDPEVTIKSDIITLHCPATKENMGFVNKNFINNMKDGAILINTARGSLINEEDLAYALKTGKLKGAGIDVLAHEPPKKPNPLIGLPNCYITPHIAWSTKEARKSVIKTSAENFKNFLEGKKLNRVD